MPPRTIDTAHRWRQMPSRTSLRARLRRTAPSWLLRLFLRTRTDVQLEACKDCGVVRVTVLTTAPINSIDEFYFTGLCYYADLNQPVDHCQCAPQPLAWER